MANGRARDGAVRNQIDSAVSDTVQGALARLALGAGARFREECRDEITAAWRGARPGCRTCIACQADRDAAVRTIGIIRRCSRDG